MRRDAVAAMLRGLRDDFAQQHGVSSKRPAALAYKELVESAGGRVRGDVNSRRDSDVKPDVPLLAEPINDDERDIWQRLWPLNSLDVRDPAQVDALARLLHKAPRAAFRYLDQHAFPTALVVRASKLSASGQALGGSLLFEKRLGFSGTPNDLLPEELGEAAFAAGDDSRILETLTDPTVAEVWPLDDNWSPRRSSRATSSGAHALIDAGALITGLNNLGVATELLKLLPETYQAVVYLDGAGKKMVLKRGVAAYRWHRPV